MTNKLNNVRHKRKIRVRSQLFGTTERPRLSVYRSNKHITAQIINDEKGITLASATDQSTKEKATKIKRAETVGKQLATKASKLNIKKVCFDRGPYKFHGRVKALAEAARASGLEF